MQVPSVDATDTISGLGYLADFLSSVEQAEMMRLVDAVEWSGELARRVQHYGYKYDYKARRIDAGMRVGELPDWLKCLGNRLVAAGVFAVAPDQVIVNEYLPGQGIAAHIDCEPCFGDTVASLSLGSNCVMDFTEAQSGAMRSVLLAPGSVVVLKEDARYRWKHSIAPRRKDTYDGGVYTRGRRLSLTFRNVKLD